MKKRREIRTSDPANWVRSPDDYPDFPPRSVRRWAGWNPSLKGYINAWYDFLCGITDTPPLPSGAVGGGHLKIAQREYRKRNGIPEPPTIEGESQ